VTAHVDSIEASAYDVPTDLPEADGTLSWDHTTVVVVRARAGSDHGLGWTYAPRAAGTLVTELLADVVKGRGVEENPAANEAMARVLRNAGRAGLGAMALSAVDIALWDLSARVAGRPLYELLGRARDAIPVYGSGGFTTYDDSQTEKQVREWLSAGIQHVKIKIGESWGSAERRDLHRVQVVRDVVGPAVGIFVDANGGYGVGQARRMARALEGLGVVWFEEPVSSDDLVGLRSVRESTTIDVAAGEYAWSPLDARRLLESQAVDCLQADITRCGGVTGFLRIAALADAFGIDVSGHCAPALHVHAALAAPRLRHVEYFHDHVRIESMLFTEAPAPLDGVLYADPDRPGLGLDLSPQAERYRVG
jgi:L-alanine-DL-glutamate epimerase-like enolase superfamily enzyme